jgi:membrane associated rhomboid family serine protease
LIPIGDETPSRRPAIVTWSLLAVNTIVFLLCISRGRYGFDEVLGRWGFVPSDFSVVTLVTSMFLHANVFHIVGNMLYLWIFGDNVEDVFGHLGFLAFYLGTGIAAGLCHFAFNMTSIRPTVGASGAISGVLGAYIVLFPHSRIRMLWWWYWYVRVFSVRAGWFLGFYFALQIVLAIMVGSESSVALWAHIGGFAAGLTVTLILFMLKVIKAPPKPAVRIDSPLARAAADAGVLRGPVDRPFQTGGAGGGVVTTRVVESGTLSADASRRIEDIFGALSGGETQKAVRLAQLELKIPRKAAAEPWALARVADAFYQGGVHAVSFRVYEEVIRRMAADDARLPEMKFRAAIIAARHLEDHNAARRLFEEVIRSHQRDDRVKLARRELSRIESNLARTGVEEAMGLLQGPCAVIRQTSEMVNVAAVGRLVAQASGKPLADVTRLVKSSVGFLATGLPPVQAKQLASQLQEMDIPALVIPEEKLVALPNAFEVAWAAASPEGVRLRAADGGEVSKGYDGIFYASCGIVGFTTRKRVADDFAIGSGPRYAAVGIGHMSAVPVEDGPRFTYKDIRTNKLVFDIFTLDPFVCYRLIEEKIDFRGSPHAVTASAHLNFRRLISDFVALGRGVPANEGVHLVAADAPARKWRRLTFGSIADFERYNYWRLQLEQYG